MPAPQEPPADQFRRQGFLVVENLLPLEMIAELRDHLADIGAGRAPGYPAGDIEFEPAKDGRQAVARKINRCAENDAVFRAAAGDKRILDLVEALLGADIKLFDSQCFMKPPGGIEKPYHQDSAYFTIEPRSLVTCWIALDDVTLENGCMWVVPQSHAGALFDHSQPWDVGGRIDMQIPAEKIDLARETPLILSAGSCSFHHSMLLHRSGPNRTRHPRRGLAIHYMSSRSRWTHPTRPRPQFPLLRGRDYPDCV